MFQRLLFAVRMPPYRLTMRCPEGRRSAGRLLLLHFLYQYNRGKINDTGDGPCLNADDAFSTTFSIIIRAWLFPRLFRAWMWGVKKPASPVRLGRVVFLDKIERYIYRWRHSPVRNPPSFVVAIDRHAANFRLLF